MSNNLKFEFDMDEVFEGIKQGFIRELSSVEFNLCKDTAIQEIKNEIKSKFNNTYNDTYNLKEEIKKEIKDKVYDVNITDIKNKYVLEFEKMLNSKLEVNIESSKLQVINNVSQGLYTDLFDKFYQSLYQQTTDKITNKLLNDSINELIGDKLIGDKKLELKYNEMIVTKEEYDRLYRQSRILNALEAGGVDNWEGYDVSLGAYFDI